MQVTYYDECKWVDVGEGLNFEFVDSENTVLARVNLRDADSKLWSFEVVLPKKFQLGEHSTGAIVYSQASARRIAEGILTSTIITR